ncbi:electron transfer flavoprotein subunit alpha/FixB family protein [Rhodothermus profundi]|uniref:Electron transfer flavoprotein subunit alpha n=1 Tax=Rhodothermus profundi TaxID=633813 RepID=A0A1M6SWE4_9BACT|nr:electron transfer flavoprotein subunit alpha/FixB family protein [Rhodothermus profundi]SHK49035.1 electron transfer flavoprotein alpha subunit apoprotein [Rhodothermus profundi]
MSTYLCYISIQQDRPTRSSLEVLTRMRELARRDGVPLAACVLHPDAERFIEALKPYGVDRIYLVQHAALAQHLNAPVLAALEAVFQAAQPAVMAFPSTEAIKDVLGALAARVSAAALPDVASFEVTPTVTVTRPVMAARVLADTEAAAQPVLISVRAGAYHAQPAETATDPEVVAVPFDFDASVLRATLREVLTGATDQVDLSEADIIVAAGRGVRDEAGKQLVETLARELGAAVGASRAAIEAGLFPASLQIGQTGKVVSPTLYIAVGISGAIQHVAGMAGSKVIVAINKDPDAPIFNIATYGIVGDLYQILPLLIEEVRRIKAGS